MKKQSRDQLQGKTRPTDSISTSESTSPTFAAPPDIPHRSSSTKKLRRKKHQKQSTSAASEEPSSSIASIAATTASPAPTSAPANPRWRLQNALSATIRAVTPEFERREQSGEEDRYAHPLIVNSGPGSAQNLKNHFNLDQELSNMSSVPSSPGGGERSPRSSSRKNREQQSSSSSRARAGSSNEIGQIAAAAAAALRPRTRTLEGRGSTGGSREASPHGSGALSGGLFGRSRSRLNSTSSAGMKTPPEDVVITSIGIPSTIPQPAVSVAQGKKRSGDGPRKLGKISRGVQGEVGSSSGLGMAQETIPEQSPPHISSSKNGIGNKSNSHAANQPERIYTPDMQNILQLMKSSRGRMEGQLAFRRFETTPWSLSFCSINDEAGSLIYEPKGRDLGASTSRAGQTSSTQSRTLIPDLRGCAIAIRWDTASGMPYMDVHPQNSKQLCVHLRPYGEEEFDSWYAALLCWQPIRPKGAQNRMTKSQLPGRSGSAGQRNKALGDENRRHSDVALPKEPPIIKVGKMFLWDFTAVSNSNDHSRGSQKSQSIMTPSRAQAVSTTLRENGELKLHLEADMSLLTTIQLSQLSRCAIQQLDKSVLGAEFCVAIYPQYHSTQSAQAAAAQNAPSRPIFISLESRVQYEVWIVLLRAFTIPQLYGPEDAGMGRHPSNASRREVAEATEESSSRPVSLASSEMFRVERSLFVRVIEARLVQPMSPRPETNHGFAFDINNQSGFNSYSNGAPNSSSSKNMSGFYTEVLLDGEVRAKTIIKPEEPTSNLSLFWREDFDFTDLPAAVSVASVVLKKVTLLSPPPSSSTKRERDEHKRYKEDSKKMQNPFSSLGTYGTRDWEEETSSEASRLEEHHLFGQVDIFLDDLEPSKDIERWWPMVNQFGQGVGEILVKVMAEENVILMAKDYQPMSEMLHRFPNGLTLQMAQKLPGELKRLSQCLLNIFQVSSSVIEWLSALIEEEIDGTLAKEASFAMGPINPLPSSVRLRFNNRRMSANENGEVTLHSHHFDRELFLRDMGKSATLEANLLFRGNTLLTKSLDLHMKRLGKDYLEETLGDKLREIADRNLDCEVDPNKITNSNDLDRNWRKLITYTAQCWECISQSALKCPSELRYIFRHIRACAEDRYGDFLRTVSYSSVSGFLFLRFFCPAILNPKLFGLINEHPQNHARRTFTLIAKSLQGLANLSSFGAKEEWMEPMNAFINSHRGDFKHFLDEVCAVPSSGFPLSLPPPYRTPIAILSRLPPTSREGFLSLPHLIDHAKSFAALVSLWLASCKKPPTEESTGIEGESTTNTHNNELFKFHQECLRLKQRAEECLAQAERAECPGPKNEELWEGMVEDMETNRQAQEQLRQQQQQRRPMSPADASDEESDKDTKDSGLTMAGGLAVRSASLSVNHMQQHYDHRYHPPPSHPLLHHHHARADSAGITNSGSSRTLIGSRATSGNESPLSNRPWRGPGRQLSLEILPSNRSGSFSGGSVQKPSLAQATSSGSVPKASSQLHTPVFENPQYTSYQTASPGSTAHDNNRTSPPYAESETSVDNNDSHIVSGRTTPSQLVRSVADVRIQPWSYGSVVSSTREQELVLSGNGARRLDQNSSNSGFMRPTPGSKDRPSTSANTSSNAPSDWTSERVFVSNNARGNRHIHIDTQTPQGVPYSFPNSASATNNRNRREESPSAQHSQSARVPRRDWGFEERARRDERLGRLTGGTTSGTHSPAWAGHLSSAEEEDEEDADVADQSVGSGDEGDDFEEKQLQQQRDREARHHHSHSLSGNSNNITALPPAPKSSSSKKTTASAATRAAAAAAAASSADRPMSERPLLERMMFKKRKQ